MFMFLERSELVSYLYRRPRNVNNLQPQKLQKKKKTSFESCTSMQHCTAFCKQLDLKITQSGSRNRINRRFSGIRQTCIYAAQKNLVTMVKILFPNWVLCPTIKTHLELKSWLKSWKPAPVGGSIHLVSSFIITLFMGSLINDLISFTFPSERVWT